LRRFLFQWQTREPVNNFFNTWFFLSKLKSAINICKLNETAFKNHRKFEIVREKSKVFDETSTFKSKRKNNNREKYPQDSSRGSPSPEDSQLSNYFQSHRSVVLKFHPSSHSTHQTAQGLLALETTQSPAALVHTLQQTLLRSSYYIYHTPRYESGQERRLRRVHSPVDADPRELVDSIRFLVTDAHCPSNWMDSLSQRPSVTSVSAARRVQASSA
jgi:hypothetical protein